MSDCQRKFSMENCRKETLTTQGGQKKRYKRIPIFQLSPGNRLHRIDQIGVASLTKELHNLNQREPVKLKGSFKKGKQEPRDYH